jgi:hypothetical protein
MCVSSLPDAKGRNLLKQAEVIKWGVLITLACLAAVISGYHGITLAHGMQHTH